VLIKYFLLNCRKRNLRKNTTKYGENAKIPTKRAKKGGASQDIATEPAAPNASNEQEMAALAPNASNQQEMAAPAPNVISSPTRLTRDHIIQNSPIRVTRGYATY
jgi:hypothetical protein